MSKSIKNVQEYSIRVPKHVQKKHHVMRFNGSLDIDFGKWTQVKMERENNLKEFKGIEEDQPKFGAGSEFGKEAKDEARRKKLGIVTRKYKPDDQPWILKSSGSSVKKFKGIREGGVSENAAYYVFTHASDGAIEAFPLHEWYKFQPIQRYKALSAEEAEQEFTKRNKNINFFTLMLRKRLKGDEGDDGLEDGEEAKGKKNTSKKSKELKISDMDEWMDSSDEESSENEEEGKPEEAEKNDKKKKDKKSVEVKKKKPKRDTDLEAFEDSDDGDGEGRELDYISDSSESEQEPENSKLQGVAEEKALRKLLTSDEGSEDDSDKSEKQMSNDDEEKNKEQETKEESDSKPKEKKLVKKKKKLTKKDILRKDPNRALEKDSSSDFSPDSSTDEEASKSNAKKFKSHHSKKNHENRDRDKDKDKDSKDKEKEKEEKEKESNSANSSRSASPITDGKRKLNHSDSSQMNKKIKLELLIPGLSESGITEESVRRYLMRKPMTTTELLQKCKSKKSGLSSEQLLKIMTQILKKINPVKQTIQGKMYLSIK